MSLVTRGLGGLLITHGFGPGPSAEPGPIVPAYTSIRSVSSHDARTVSVVFFTRVNQSDAENPSMYTITPPLAVHRITRITETYYRLTTARQVTDQAYMLEISGIREA